MKQPIYKAKSDIDVDEMDENGVKHDWRGLYEI